MRRRQVEPLAPEAQAAESGAVDSLQRGLEALRCFHPGEDVLETAELARRLGLTRPTTRRLLDTLALHGFLMRVPGKDQFGLHVACLVVGHALLGTSALVRAARRLLQSFAQRYGAAALVGVQDRDYLLVLAHAAADGVAAGGLGAGMRVPIAGTPFGHAWLWTQPAQVLAGWLARLREGSMPAAGAPNAAGLYRAFHDLEEKGVCHAAGEARRHVRFYAAPAIFRDGSVAVIGCARPSEGGKAGPQQERECAAALAALAGAVREGAERTRA